jgi:hypothetical protein
MDVLTSRKDALQEHTTHKRWVPVLHAPQDALNATASGNAQWNAITHAGTVSDQLMSASHVALAKC